MQQSYRGASKQHVLLVGGDGQPRDSHLALLELMQHLTRDNAPAANSLVIAASVEEIFLAVENHVVHTTSVSAQCVHETRAHRIPNVHISAIGPKRK
eukprot:6178466-Pleurochrysis_carterae.AAC.2